MEVVNKGENFIAARDVVKELHRIVDEHRKMLSARDIYYLGVAAGTLMRLEEGQTK